MTLAHTARTWVRKSLKLDVQRYPQSDPLYHLSRLLRHLEIDLALDVGANDGGYASSLRNLGYAARIISFEPLAEPFARLSDIAAQDSRWDVVRTAVGDRDGEIVIHVAGNDGASSSALPMLDAHLAAAPSAAYVADEKVPVQRLDALVGGQVEGRRCFLKLDVQGFERNVLDGAASILAGGHVLGVQAEMSLVPLYDGSMLWRETVDRMSATGYELASLMPGFTDTTTGASSRPTGCSCERTPRPGGGEPRGANREDRPTAERPMNQGRAVAGGAVVLVSSQVLVTVVQVVTGAGTARLLSPSAFGTFAAAIAITRTAERHPHVCHGHGGAPRGRADPGPGVEALGDRSCAGSGRGRRDLAGGAGVGSALPHAVRRTARAVAQHPGRTRADRHDECCPPPA